MKKFFKGIHPVVLIGSIMTPITVLIFNLISVEVGLSPAEIGFIIPVVVALVLSYASAFVFWKIRNKLLLNLP